MTTTTPRVSLMSHIFTMPRWQRILLTLAAIATATGLSGQAAGYLTDRSQPAAVQPDSARSAVAQSDQPPPPPEKPLYQKLSPHATRIGLTFLVGFVIGWAFRAFVKMMAMIAALAFAIFFGLSYFNVMNVDLSKAEKKFNSSKEWVTDQAWRVKDSILSHIPSSGASVFGMFVGFRRKK